MSLCTIQTGRDPNRCTADCSQPGRFTTWTFSFKLSKPAKQRRLSLRDTFKKKEKLFLQSCSISGTECKFDFPDEAPLLSLAEFIPHPYFSSHLLTSQEFFSPQKGKSSLLVCRAVEVQTPHFSFSEVWKWNIHDYRELSLRESGESEMKMEKKTVAILTRHSNFHGVPALF